MDNIQNIDSLDQKTLNEMEAKLAAELARVAEAKLRIMARERATDLEIIMGLVEKHSLTLADLDVAAIFPPVVSSKRAYRRAALAGGSTTKAHLEKQTLRPKYRSPNGEVWTGRGKNPRWLVEEMTKHPTLSKGELLKKFLISG